MGKPAPIQHILDSVEKAPRVLLGHGAQADAKFTRVVLCLKDGFLIQGETSIGVTGDTGPRSASRARAGREQHAHQPCHYMTRLAAGAMSAGRIKASNPGPVQLGPGNEKGPVARKQPGPAFTDRGKGQSSSHANRLA
jgi:hypothetical protein